MGNRAADIGEGGMGALRWLCVGLGLDKCYRPGVHANVCVVQAVSLGIRHTMLCEDVLADD